MSEHATGPPRDPDIDAVGLTGLSDYYLVDDELTAVSDDYERLLGEHDELLAVCKRVLNTVRAVRESCDAAIVSLAALRELKVATTEKGESDA